MNNEESRLRTFGVWPSDAAVDPARIAKAGFFYTGQGMEVQCFSCGGKITEWNYGDQVMAKHKRLDPHCPFVINPSNSGNVPKLGTTSSSTAQLPPTSGEDALFRTVSSRLDTFSDWPVPHVVTPEDLANAGFYSLKQDDKVKCAYCNGIAGFWVDGDDPKTEHRRHFPYCAFVVADFNPEALDSNRTTISPLDANTKLVSSENLSELGIQVHKGPRQPRYSTLESRLRTFGNWSMDLIQTPEMLADAGFYYVGTGDQVRCFHCDGGLRHWDPQDEPWVEHARWFPSCAYLRFIKGPDFIRACNPEELAHNNLTSTISSYSNGRPATTPTLREISDREMQTYMNSTSALAALSVGLPLGSVKQAILQKIQQTGSDYSSPDALIEAALNLQRDESDPHDSDMEESVSNLLSTIVSQSQNELQSPTGQQNLNNKKNESTDKIVSKVVEVKEEKKLSLEEENRILKEARLCKICMDNEIGVVFLPCGHLTTCVICAPSLKDCPVCRSVIKGTVRTFLS